MPISAEQLKQEIKDEVIGEDLDTKVDIWWDAYADTYPTNIGLQYLYTRWKILTLLLAKKRSLVDMTTGSDTVKHSQEYAQVAKDIDRAWKEILDIDPEKNESAKNLAVSETMKHNAARSSSEKQGRFVYYK
jgi:hypothetical protein